MGVMDEAVQDGVRQGRIAEGLMPMGHWQLAGNDRRAALVALVEQLQQIAAALIIEDRQPPVVEHQDIDLGDVGHELEVAPVGPRQGELSNSRGRRW